MVLCNNARRALTVYGLCARVLGLWVLTVNGPSSVKNPPSESEPGPPFVCQRTETSEMVQLRLLHGGGCSSKLRVSFDALPMHGAN
eukprot:SAG31_NODE_14658_length_794_cov_0.804317_1_plen_85_part_10